MNELMRRAFQRRSERYLANPDQMLLDFGQTPEAGDATEGNRANGGRKRFPATFVSSGENQSFRSHGNITVGVST